MTDQTPDLCPTCGIDLNYPTGPHILNCPAPAAAPPLNGMTDQTPSTEDVRHHLVEIEPSDSICHECSTFDGHVYTDTVEWPCPVETRDRETAEKAVRDVATSLRDVGIHWPNDVYVPLIGWLDTRADRIEAGDGS